MNWSFVHSHCFFYYFHFGTVFAIESTFNWFVLLCWCAICWLAIDLWCKLSGCLNKNDHKTILLHSIEWSKWMFIIMIDREKKKTVGCFGFVSIVEIMWLEGRHYSNIPYNRDIIVILVVHVGKLISWKIFTISCYSTKPKIMNINKNRVWKRQKTCQKQKHRVQQAQSKLNSYVKNVTRGSKNPVCVHVWIDCQFITFLRMLRLLKLLLWCMLEARRWTTLWLWCG